MRNRKLCILACCVGVSGATFLATQTVAQSNAADDQTRALEALRAAEAGPIVPDVVAPNAAPTPVVPTPEPAVRPAPAPADNSSIVAPTPAITSGDDQNKALNALRKEESQPVAPGVSHSGPLTMQEKEAMLVEAQRQRKLAEEKAITDRAGMEETVKRQRAEDEARVKAAMDKARSDIAAQEAVARDQQAADDVRLKQAMDAERVAADQVRIARAEEAAAAERAHQAKLREEAAERARVAQAQAEAERLKKQMGVKSLPPGMEPVVTTPTAKEAKLADLLRRYQADQITPYEYHLQRAKIIPEP